MIAAIFAVLLAQASPLPASAPAAAQPAPMAAPVELAPGQMFRVPGRAETFVVEPGGGVRAARPDEAAAPAIGDAAVKRTGLLSLVVGLFAFACTWLTRNWSIFNGWFARRSPLGRRLVPWFAAAAGTAATSWLAGASSTEAASMLLIGALGALGGHQTWDGAARTVAVISKGAQPTDPLP